MSASGGINLGQSPAANPGNIIEVEKRKVGIITICCRMEMDRGKETGVRAQRNVRNGWLLEVVR